VKLPDPNFPPVDLASPLDAWDSPQFIPGHPHNLPAKGALPSPSFLLGGTQLLDAPPSSPQTTNATGPAAAPSNKIFDPHHYASVITGILNPVSTLQQNAVFLNAPANRRNMLSLRNASATGGANIYIDFNASAQVNSPYKIVPGQTLLFDVVVPQDDLYAFADAASGVLAYSYSTISGIAQ
jgi:hypothetical protein